MAYDDVAPVRRIPEIPYSPITERPPLELPDGARVALWLSPNIEFYEFVPPHNPYRNPWSRMPQAPDVLLYSYKDYGNRVGLWRMADVFDHYGLRATVSLNVAVLDHFPEIAEAMVERDWDFMSHGIYNTRALYGMPEDEEREWLVDNIETVRRRTGKQLKGLFGPDATATPNTMRLLAEAGLIYSCDWYLDDQPFPIHVPTGKLVGVPYSWELNDALMLAPGLGTFDEAYFAQICRDQFDVLYEEGAESGRVMCIALHPYLMGQPHRIKYLDAALDYIMSHPGVWATTADEIAEHYLASAYDAQVALDLGGTA